MRPYRIAALVTVLITLIVAFSGITSNVCAESSPVSCNFSYSILSGHYSPTVSITATDSRIAPGDSTDGVVSVSDESLTITLSILGSQASISVNPLGEATYPVPGIYWDYLFMEVGLQLTFKGSLRGTFASSGPGSVSPLGQMEWISPGSRTIQIAADSTSKTGDVITLSLSNIAYSISIGVIASADLPIIGHYEYTIIDYYTIGVLAGSPSSISESVGIESPSSSWILVASISGVSATAAVIAAFVILSKKRKIETATQLTNASIGECLNCGRSIQPDWGACAFCGKELR
jgi:hypothetical protein